jgi:hypothetical protein
MLCDSEVLTIEIVGEFLGLDKDTELFAYFRRHYAHFFPNLRCIAPPSAGRQRTCGRSRSSSGQKLLADTPDDPTFAICDSMPLPVCLFARAYRCRRFRGEAAFGKRTRFSDRPSMVSGCT